MGLRSDLEATQRELNDVRIERDAANDRITVLEGEREAFEGISELLAERVNSLADEVDALAADREAARVVLERVPDTVRALRAEVKWLYQTLAAIQSYGGDDPLVPSLLAEAALSEIAEIDYGFEDGEQV